MAHEDVVMDQVSNPFPPPHGREALAGQTTPLSLLERVRANDAEAWRRLSELYRPLVLTWCGRLGVNRTDAEDVAQEVFAAAARALSDFHRDRPGDTFAGWLRAITRNEVLQLFRRTQGRARAAGGSEALADLQEVADPLPGPGEDEAVEMSQLYLRALEQVRGRFAEHIWQAFWRTVIDNRDTAAVARELGLSAENVRQARSRVLRRLREELGEMLE